MRPRKSTYIAHRWIGLVISLQLLAWSVGGFVFSILDIKSVRGITDSRMLAMNPFGTEQVPSLSPSILASLSQVNTDDIGSVTLIDRGVGPHWEIRDPDNQLLIRLDAQGKLANRLTPQEAGLLALRDFIPETTVISVELIEHGPPGEYRNKQLPAYKVSLDHTKDPHIYIDATTGRVEARRNKSWRLFDFFWMLHTMDYKGRDNFNHPLLTIASLLAIATSGTGIALWGWRTIPKAIRQRRSLAP